MTTTDHYTTLVQSAGPDYYYTKPSTPITVIGSAPNQEQLATLAKFAADNKNPLNFHIPGIREVSLQMTHTETEYYDWPIPFCFSWPQYEQNSEEGITQWRLAKDFWANIETVKPGFKVFSARLILVPAGSSTERHSVNPMGPRLGAFWFAGGACRLHIPLVTNTSAVFNVGSDSQHLEANTVYEINNLLINQLVNNGNDDIVVLDIDLVPEQNAEELEARILNNPILSSLHVRQASGLPVHTTVYL